MPERKNLFRTEAVVSHTPKHYGSSFVYQPLSLKFFSFSVLALFVIGVLFLYFAKFKTTVVVRGSLSPFQGLTKIYPSEIGQYSDILVFEGQYVNRGDIIAEISQQKYDANGRDKSDTLRYFYGTEKEYLQKEIEATNGIYFTSDNRLSNEIKGLEHTIASLGDEHGITQQLLSLSISDLEAQQSLYENSSISLYQLNQKKANYLGLLQQVKSIETKIGSRKTQLLDRSYERDLLVSSLQKKLREFNRQLDQISFNIEEIDSGKLTTLLAPSNGVVTGITSSIGDTIDSREPLLTITPQSAQLIATLYVPSSAIGIVKEDQKVLLNYDPFEFQVYGNYEGTISSISKTSVDPREHLFPIENLRQPVFLIKVRLSQQYVEGVNRYSLHSGMLLSAEIITAEMTIFEYIFDPLTKLIRKS